jgi:hypothetical protein
MYFKIQQNHSNVVKWLIDNVGPELEYEPGVFWRGKDWTVIYDRPAVGRPSTDYWVLDVTINDDRVGTLFLLAFS